MLLNGFFRSLKNFHDLIKKKIIDVYKNSNFYEKKISKTLNTVLIQSEITFCTDFFEDFKSRLKNQKKLFNFINSFD